MTGQRIGRSYSWYLEHRCVLTDYERHIIATTDVPVTFVPAGVGGERGSVPIVSTPSRLTDGELRAEYDRLMAVARAAREEKQKKPDVDFYGRKPTTATKGLTRAEIQVRMQLRVEMAGRMWADGTLSIASLCEAAGVTQNVASIAIRDAKKQGLIIKE